MAGADISVTDARLADLVLEYAKWLGRARTTDTVTIPVARNGRAEEASLLLGPASQIAITDNDEPALDAIDLPGVQELSDDLHRRIDDVNGSHRVVDSMEDGDVESNFVDFDAYGP